VSNTEYVGAADDFLPFEAAAMTDRLTLDIYPEFADRLAPESVKEIVSELARWRE
jgi:hypothetical protein